MKKRKRKLLALSICIALGLVATGLLWAKLPAEISGIVRNKIFKCVLKGPYQYMFEPTLPMTQGQHPKNLTEYRGGTQGILFYGDLVNCIGGKSKTWADLKPLESALGMKATNTEHSWLEKSYRPEIIDWATKNLIPKPNEKIYGVSYQKIYNKTMRRFFRVMAASFKYLKSKPGRLTKETKFYRIARGHYQTFWHELYSRYDNILPKFKIPRDDSQLTVPIAIGFWIRRSADKTSQALWQGNKKVLKLYDKPWYTSMELAGLTE